MLSMRLRRGTMRGVSVTACVILLSLGRGILNEIGIASYMEVRVRCVAANCAQDFTTVDADILEVAVAHRQKLGDRLPIEAPSRVGSPPVL